MEISAIALRGLNEAQAQLEQAGGRFQTTTTSSRPIFSSITAAGTTSIKDNSGDGMPVDTANLSDAAVSLLSAKNAFATNIKLLKVADEMQRQAIDLVT
jgi:flagellar basal body rod protein FlgG